MGLAFVPGLHRWTPLTITVGRPAGLSLVPGIANDADMTSDPLLAGLRIAVDAAPDDLPLRLHLAKLLIKARLRAEVLRGLDEPASHIQILLLPDPAVRWPNESERTRRRSVARRVQEASISLPYGLQLQRPAAARNKNRPHLLTISEWAIQDSNLGPLPYQRSAGVAASRLQ